MDSTLSKILGIRRFSFWFIFCIILLFFLFNFLPSKQTLAQTSKVFVIANIDNHIITNLDLEKRYQFFVKSSHIVISSAAEKKFILEQLTEKLIEEKIQFIAANNLNISVSEEELDNALNEISRANGRSPEQIRSYFVANNIPYDDYLTQIKAQLLWKKIVNQLITPKIKISQTEIDEMLELAKINGKKTKLNLAEIFIPFKNEKEEIEAKSLAQKLIEEINDGADFKNIARQFSKSSSSEFNGELGWIEESALNKNIFAAIKNLDKGKVSAPIKGKDGGYYIFKIIDKKIVSNLEENDINQLRNLILNKKLKSAARGYLEELKKQSYIKKQS